MAHNHREEVIWPRLVASKLFKRPMGNNSFVADFPSRGKVEYAFSSICDDQHILKQPQNCKRDPLRYKLFASTWNVGGVIPPDDLNLEDWLDTRNNSHDIYVLGFQEIVPLSAKNILGPEKSMMTMKWNSLIRAALNKSLSNSPKEKEPRETERQKVYPVNEASSSFVQDFQCIVSKQMVGILVSVWVRGDLRRYICRTNVSCVGCGIMGCLGNKGAISVRFWLHETSFCFVCCHLASGGREGDEVYRNSDALGILSRTTFPRGHLNLPEKILDHDRVVLLGDLNYRISLPETITRSLVEQKEWTALLEEDQLHREFTSGGAFEGWQEGTIKFFPTYKYFPNSDKYYGCIQGKKGKKKRAPAWCDRVLWTGRGIKQIFYDRCECKLSDHRAVRALFSVDVDALRNLNSLRSFFLSDRYEKLVIRNGEVFTRDDQRRSVRYGESI